MPLCFGELVRADALKMDQYNHSLSIHNDTAKYTDLLNRSIWNHFLLYKPCSRSEGTIFTQFKTNNTTLRHLMFNLVSLLFFYVHALLNQTNNDIMEHVYHCVTSPFV